MNGGFGIVENNNGIERKQKYTFSVMNLGGKFKNKNKNKNMSFVVSEPLCLFFFIVYLFTN